MTRIAGASVLFATLLATTACGVGGDDGPTGGGGGDTQGSDDRNTKLGITCNATFKLSGTFTPGTPGRPIDPDTNAPITGCWPVGTWNFTAALDPASNECKTAPTALPSYSFRVDRAEGSDQQGLVDTYANLTSVNGLRWHLSVSSNGQGCEGNFEFGSADGKEYWNMQPAVLNTAQTTITGNGDYSLYNKDAWPWGTN
jgi:hypothetical protein